MMFIIFVTLIFSSTAMGSIVLPLNLDEMNQQAKHVIHGKCISNVTDFDPESNQIATWTTFTILESIKGIQDETFTIKQIGGTNPNSGISYKVHGVPKFKVGEEYFLLLYGKSKVGFSSPVGLQQGKFNVNKTNHTLGNGRNINEILSNLPEHIVLPTAVSNNLNRSIRKKGASHTIDDEIDISDFSNILRQLNNK